MKGISLTASRDEDRLLVALLVVLLVALLLVVLCTQYIALHGLSR